MADKDVNDKSYDVFLSHAAADKDAIEDIANDLSLQGLDVFYDVYEVSGGDNIPQRIQSAIKNSRYFVWVVTENSLRSYWVEREVSLAERFIDDGESIQIIPCRVDNFFVKDNALSLAQKWVNDHCNELQKTINGHGHMDDVSHLSLEKHSYVNLHARLPALFSVLNILHCESLYAAEYVQGLTRIYEKITGSATLAVSLRRSNQVDLSKEKRKIHAAYLSADDPKDIINANNLLLDYIEQNVPDNVNEATANCCKLRRIDKQTPNEHEVFTETLIKLFELMEPKDHE